ncbi:MAG: putative Ig domain-containing protein [Mycoplasmoidaceae bacterium]|nr:putative Ig domain-containing protein [Mycoplasmoidaceae bacterium]
MVDKTTGQIAALAPTGANPATITATSVAPTNTGGHATATIAVSVIPAPTVTLTYEPEELEIPTSQFVEASPTVSTSGFTSTVTKTYSTQTTLPSGVSLNPTTGVLSVASSTVLTGVLLVDIKVTCTDEDGHTASDNFTVTVKNPESAKDEFYVNNYVLHEETGVAELSSGSITHNVGGTFNAEALVEYQLID